METSVTDVAIQEKEFTPRNREEHCMYAALYRT